MAKKDYYVLLGIPRFKSPAGIHEAFRRLAKKYHPDLGGPETAEAFQEIAHAYEILSDPEQRRTYDQALLREYEGDSPPAGKGTVPLKREGALKLEPVAQA